MNCLTCERAIEFSGKGRPPTYCSKFCRRVAEYEIRRIQRRLIKLEAISEDLKTVPNTWNAIYNLPRIEKQIESAESRLRYLLGDKNDH